MTTNHSFSSWITGFVDGEGCFHISINLRSKSKYGVSIVPSFSLSQKGDRHHINVKLLESIEKHFQCGFIRFCQIDGTYKYESRNLRDLRKNILPHFDEYPLQTKKRLDFEKFKEACELIAQCEHLHLEGLRKVIDVAYEINNGKRKCSKESLLKLIER